MGGRPAFPGSRAPPSVPPAVRQPAGGCSAWAPRRPSLHSCWGSGSRGTGREKQVLGRVDAGLPPRHTQPPHAVCSAWAWGECAPIGRQNDSRDGRAGSALPQAPPQGGSHARLQAPRAGATSRASWELRTWCRPASRGSSGICGPNGCHSPAPTDTGGKRGAGTQTPRPRLSSSFPGTQVPSFCRQGHSCGDGTSAATGPRIPWGTEAERGASSPDKGPPDTAAPQQSLAGFLPDTGARTKAPRDSGHGALTSCQALVAHLRYTGGGGGPGQGRCLRLRFLSRRQRRTAPHPGAPRSPRVTLGDAQLHLKVHGRRDHGLGEHQHILQPDDHHEVREDLAGGRGGEGEGSAEHPRHTASSQQVWALGWGGCGVCSLQWGLPSDPHKHRAETPPSAPTPHRALTTQRSPCRQVASPSPRPSAAEGGLQAHLSLSLPHQHLLAPGGGHGRTRAALQAGP